jgi:LysR family transcriptional regulator, hypochlorite-specific transcription factor HypT
VHEQAAASLQFAATHALSLTFFPTWLSRIEALLPLARDGRKMGPIQMVSDSFAACEDVMLQRRAQFLLCHGHPAVGNRLDDAQFMFVKVGEDLLIPVTAAAASGKAAHVLGATKHNKPIPVLMYGEASGIGQIMRSVMQAELEAGRFTTVFTAHHAVLLKTMALEGRGIAWLPQSLIVNELEARRLVPAGDARWTVPIEVRLFRPRAELTGVAEELWRVVCDAANTAL